MALDAKGPPLVADTQPLLEPGWMIKGKSSGDHFMPYINAEEYMESFTKQRRIEALKFAHDIKNLKLICIGRGPPIFGHSLVRLLPGTLFFRKMASLQASTL